MLSPLPIAHRTDDDSLIRSVSYDRVHGILEIDYGWTGGNILQYRPVSPALFRQFWGARPMHEFLSARLKWPRVTWEYVRTERKV
jgi:hypothetical protein